MAPRDFAGKVVVITGGAGGIGMALARAFGSVGAKIGIIDLPSSPLGEAQRGRLHRTALFLFITERGGQERP